jgi:ssDNA-binding Zn-finger/Zn-ribbon topoisomerase 1
MKVTCPYCGRVAGNKHIRGNCPAKPRVHEAVGRLIENPATPGIARSTSNYIAARVASGDPDAAGAAGLTNYYGSWAACCEHYGLSAPADTMTPCPHCHVEMRHPIMAFHMTVCLCNPTVYDAVYDALTAGCDDGEAIGQEEYIDYRAIYDDSLPGAQTIMDYANTRRWGVALAKLGLVQRKRTYRRAVNLEEERATRAMAAIEDERQQVQRILREERNGAYGLAVLAVKPAPGLRVNGKPCVVSVLR